MGYFCLLADKARSFKGEQLAVCVWYVVDLNVWERFLTFVDCSDCRDADGIASSAQCMSSKSANCCWGTWWGQCYVQSRKWSTAWDTRCVPHSNLRTLHGTQAEFSHRSCLHDQLTSYAILLYVFFSRWGNHKAFPSLTTTAWCSCPNGFADWLEWHAVGLQMA